MKKIIYILAVLLLAVSLFAENETPEEKESKEAPKILCMVLYSDKEPAIVNISFSEDKDINYIKEKAELFRKNYKANEIKPLTEGEETDGISFTVSGASYDPGTGDSLEPFINTFSDEKEIIVYFMGDYVPCDYPLTFYEKGDFYLLMKLHDNTMEYRIHPGGQAFKLPADQKTATAYKVIKKIGIYLCYAIGIIILLIFMAALLKRAVKRSKRAKRNIYD